MTVEAPRLARPRRDVNKWGGITNKFLRVSHNEDGTLKASLFGEINAKDFGAHSITESGYETFDSTSAIQAAVDSMVNGDTFRLQSGDYKTTSVIAIGSSDADLRYCKFIFDGVIKANDCSGITFERVSDCTIDINAVKYDPPYDWGGGYWGVKFKRFYHSKVNVNLSWHFTYGLYFDGNVGGVSYNRFYFSSVRAKYGLNFKSQNSGWVNANSYHGGKIWVDSTTKAAKSGGWGIYFEDNPSNNFYSHSFYDVVLESLHNGIHLSKNYYTLLSNPYFEAVDDNHMMSSSWSQYLTWIVGTGGIDRTKLDLTTFRQFVLFGYHSDDHPSSIMIDGGAYGGIVPVDATDNLTALGRCSINKTDKCWQFENADGYIQKLSAVRQEYGAAAPGVGTWQRGSMVWNTTPSAGNPLGWMCVTAGTPGTWKAMANLEA